jgi:hypothetical protein
MAKSGTWDAVRQYLQRSAGLTTSVVVVLPLVVLYNLGVIMSGWSALNGADLVTLTLLRWIGREGWVIFQAVLAVSFVGAIAYLRHKGQFHWRYFAPLLIESSVYAVSMGTLILSIMAEVSLLGPSPSPGVLEALTVSAGAGVHEELLFRLALIPLGTRALVRGAEVSPTLGATLAVVASSILFSLAHYLGPESFEVFSFVYRSLAGLLFALLFLLRGFAVAVYTHFLYDVYVMLAV